MFFILCMAIWSIVAMGESLVYFMSSRLHTSKTDIWNSELYDNNITWHCWQIRKLLLWYFLMNWSDFLHTSRVFFNDSDRVFFVYLSTWTCVYVVGLQRIRWKCTPMDRAEPANPAVPVCMPFYTHIKKDVFPLPLFVLCNISLHFH